MIPTQPIRTVSDAVVADGCLYHLIGEQSAGDMRNLKPGGAVAIKDATFTDGEAWVNPGYMTTGADSTAYAVLTKDQAGFTLEGQALILAFRFRKPTPASTEVIAASVAPGSTVGGYIFDARSAGNLILTVVALDGGNNVIGVNNALDDAEHTVVFFVPRGADDSASMVAWLDGRREGTGTAANVAGKDCRGPNDLRIGCGWPTIAAKPARVAVAAAYQVPKNISSLNQALIADYLHRNPGMPLENWHL